MSLQLAAASYIYIYYALKKKRKEQRWWQRQLYTSSEVYSGSRFLAELNFQSVSGLYKKFTRMYPSEFEFLINMIGEKISKKTQRSGKHFCSRKVALTHSSTGLFISFPSSSHASCFLILLKCGCFGSQIISFLL